MANYNTNMYHHFLFMINFLSYVNIDQYEDNHNQKHKRKKGKRKKSKTPEGNMKVKELLKKMGISTPSKTNNQHRKLSTVYEALSHSEYTM